MVFLDPDDNIDRAQRVTNCSVADFQLFLKVLFEFVLF